MSIVPSLGRMRQVDLYEFQASLARLNSEFRISLGYVAIFRLA